ncbi:Calcium and calcium/calmodulin-dependent serine/threonine-protein kinase [Madurella mycetomatis]|uniref:Calcium and calcium/calmodulin-dependent serine/threonine-protein kinase n=1 Tax=Madurella mycetomatis TaxID=100816 RepID=A0A175VX24_9PEZI|nr:Calcium and calcium/calmodulin-dependent serine/threonine-protein kinase [Madurella mycetomatis]
MSPRRRNKRNPRRPAPPRQSHPGLGIPLPPAQEVSELATIDPTNERALPNIDLSLATEHGGVAGPSHTLSQFLRDASQLPGGDSSESHRTPEVRDAHPNRYLGIPGSRDHTLYTPSYDEKTRLLSDFTVCSDLGLDLEGQHIARVADSQKPISYDAVGSPDCLVQALRDDLEPTLSAFFGKSESYFLPWTKLHRVLSADTVLRLLQHLNEVATDREHYRDYDLPALTAKIAPPLSKLGRGRGVNAQFRRTLATLILVRRESMIFSFVDAGLDDGSLLKIDFDGLEPASRTKRAHSALFDGWKPKEIKDFKSLRWQLSPTFFSVKRSSGAGAGGELPGDLTDQDGTRVKRVRYKLRSIEEVLPFEASKRPAASGGFADVRFFRLHEDQQDFPRFTRRGKENDIAVKTLKNEAKDTAGQYDSYLNEVYVMERLASAIDSQHMAKLLATIEVPRAIHDRERSDYHLVLEAADRSVENLWSSQDWWDRYPDRGITELELAKWVARQCYGLADALWKFHRFPRTKNDGNDKTHGLHCDIKPDNILHYENWKLDTGRDSKGTVHEQLGVLQLSDFGLSSFHSARSVENYRIAGNFLDYAAPETDFLLVHSPAADIWHLGCLFLDFVTWLLDGPKGYKKFCRDRLTTTLRGERCRFATFTPDTQEAKSTEGLPSGKSPRTYVEVNEKVLKQGTYLCRHPKSSAFVRELCHLAINYMLVMRDTNQTQKVVEYRHEPQAVPDRLTSEKVAGILGKVITWDDDKFKPSRANVLAFEDHAWRRSDLLLYYDTKQLQKISQRVRSGLDPEDAGLERPGVTMVRGEEEP